MIIGKFGGKNVALYPVWPGRNILKQSRDPQPPKSRKRYVQDVIRSTYLHPSGGTGRGSGRLLHGDEAAEREKKNYLKYILNSARKTLVETSGECYRETKEREVGKGHSG